MVRRTAGAIGAYVGTVFAVPLLLNRMGEDLARYSPIIIVANSLATALPTSNQLSPPAGFLVLAGYGAAALLLGGATMVRRDP